MKRLFQLATVMLLLAGFVAPIIEFFDQWDPEGFADDTEFGVFALIFVLCFVLLLCKLISTAAQRLMLGECNVLPREKGADGTKALPGFILVIPPLYSPPLRI